MTTPARRPGCVPVVLAGFCAALNVWSFSQADWNGVWGAWLTLFLTEELWAAWARTGGTLSTRLWVWLGVRPPRRWRQVRIGAAAVFVAELGAHIVTGGAYWWSGGIAIIWTAVPVAVVVGYALLREREGSVGLQGLKDKAVRWLALRWLKGKVADKEGTVSKVLQAFKGWKMVIGVILVFAAAVYDQMTNGHAGDITGAVLMVLGWMPADTWLAQIRESVPSMVVIIGLIGKLITAHKQSQAGATVGELLSTKGYIKESVAEVGLPKTLAMAADVTPPVIKG